MRQRYVTLIVASSYILLIIVIIAITLRTLLGTSKKVEGTHQYQEIQNKCSAHTCGAADPVSEPSYNMQNVIKQSILLEEHLAEDKKYCIDCVCKHYLHIIALLEEALMLAGENWGKYPMLKESLVFYDESYKAWLKGKNEPNVRVHEESKLREWRKRLVQLYILQ
jgi:hypothetical protein